MSSQSQSVHTEIKHSDKDITYIFVFFAKYYNQRKNLRLSFTHDGKVIPIMSKKMLWERFCMLNNVSKNLRKWSTSEIMKLSSMDDKTLYHSLLEAFGSVTKEMI